VSSFVLACEKRLEPTAQLVAGAAESIQSVLFAAPNGRRVRQAPVQPSSLAEEERALLLAAESDDRVHLGGRISATAFER